MKICITGVAGLLGSRFSDWLINNTEHTVIGIDDLSGGYIDNINKGVEFYKFDLAVGENDDMIDYKKTIKYLLKNSKKFTNDNYLKGNHGHRTPIEVLEQILLKFNLPYL